MSTSSNDALANLILAALDYSGGHTEHARGQLCAAADQLRAAVGYPTPQEVRVACANVFPPPIEDPAVAYPDHRAADRHVTHPLPAPGAETGQALEEARADQARLMR